MTKNSLLKSVFKTGSIAFLILLTVCCQPPKKEEVRKPKAVFIIVDGIPGDVIQKLNPPVLGEISKEGGFTLAHVGGAKGSYSETPTISAVGYNSLLTGTWVNKHNVWDNDIAAPNYNYWNLFRIAEKSDPGLKTAVFSTWEDNRTKLVGEGLDQAGNITLDFKFDGLEHDTVRYPHDTASLYINRIDEAVSDEAARVISAEGPDLSWVYLEFTDDMGHRFGDSPQFHVAIFTADKQIGKIWNAIKQREKEFQEDWLIVITTDHGRDAETGHNHGGQSDRERSTWIVTNAGKRNARFEQNPGIVDIFPTICNHLKLPIPEEVQREADGVAFIGQADIADLKAEKQAGKILITWNTLHDSPSGDAEIFVTETNHFKDGGQDAYRKVGEVSTQAGKYEFEVGTRSDFYKIVLKTPAQFANVWIVEKK
jgi:predicted AlkP superfamily pyrophosphatase or phosphodiesterase